MAFARFAIGRSLSSHIASLIQDAVRVFRRSASFVTLLSASLVVSSDECWRDLVLSRTLNMSLGCAAPLVRPDSIVASTLRRPSSRTSPAASAAEYSSCVARVASSTLAPTSIPS